MKVMVFELFEVFVFGIMHNFPLQCALESSRKLMVRYFYSLLCIFVLSVLLKVSYHPLVLRDECLASLLVLRDKRLVLEDKSLVLQDG